MRIERVSREEALKLLDEAQPKRNKFRAKAETVDGKRFDSKREGRRWSVLRLLERAGQIANLRRQVWFVLHGPMMQVLCRYKADYVYEEGGRTVVEDCKGVRTPMYRLKKKWMLAEHGIAIKET